MSFYKNVAKTTQNIIILNSCLSLSEKNAQFYFFVNHLSLSLVKLQDETLQSDRVSKDIFS